ncbi:MAG: histidine kinase [Erysipelotrichaceae bacterium]|nr:histidine kinase [Erysipelotrichaceae bacterium]
MIQKKLLIVNIVLIILTLGIATDFEARALRDLLYQENTLTYNNMVSSSYDALNTIFTEGEDKLLIVCSNRDLQELVKKTRPDKVRIDDAVRNLRSILSVEDIVVLPVKNNNVYTYNSYSKEYVLKQKGLDGYPLNYSYKWHFRPEGRDVVTVTRAMYSLDNIDEIIAIISVELSTTDFTEIIYSFKGSSFNDYLCLLDEENNYLLPYNRSGKMEIENPQNGVISTAPFTDNTEILTVANSFRQNNWKLITVLSASSLFQDTRNLMSLLVFVAGILAAVGIFLTYLITGRIMAPIRKLSSEMHDIRTSKKFNNISAPEGATGEIKELYDSFNHLVDQVNLSMSEVEEFSRKDSDNQFRLLQAEINPHFLYNTLNTISWMAANNQNEDIQKVVIALVGLYRISLNKGKATLPLRQEIEHVRNYLEIMSFRYPGRYETEFNIAEETNELIITKQILQPLAENALMHGFLEGEKTGKIIISSEIDGNDLLLKVSNTGKEIELDKVNKLLQNDPEMSQNHYGIRNVNERLMMYYGPQCHLQYDVVDEMTVVSIRLPLEKLKVGM